MNESEISTCASCGARAPRTEMFGLEPELQCPACAQQIRVRTQVRSRPLLRYKKPIVTVACLVICTGIWLAATLGGASRQTPAWLGLIMQDLPIWKGEVWRHLTCTFIHLDWWHWLLNGWALWSLGRIFEATYGRLAMLGVTVATGAGAAALSWIFTPHTAVGLSGALFGLCGFLWAQRHTNTVAAAVMTQRMRNWLLTLLVVGFVLSQSGKVPISNWGHGGGLALGFALGWAAAQKERRLLVPATALAIAGVIALSVFLPLGESGWINTQTREPIDRFELRAQYLAGKLNNK